MKTHGMIMGIVVGSALGFAQTWAADLSGKTADLPKRPTANLSGRAATPSPELVRASKTFERGNQAFGESRYKDAIQSYKAILKEDGVFAHVLFNLANAQYRDGQIGEAILNLERARVLRPRDPDIVANLSVIRKAASLFPPKNEPWFKAASFLSWNEWAWLACGALGMVCFFTLLRVMQPSWSFAFFNFILILVWLSALASMAGLWTTRHRAVVTAKEATTRISPFETAAAAFPVQEGEVVTAQAVHENYILVSNRLGKIAWLPREQAEIIISSPSQTQ
ncbi:MAG: hypothetical protein V1746_05110 [bacterium]